MYLGVFLRLLFVVALDDNEPVLLMLDDNEPVLLLLDDDEPVLSLLDNCGWNIFILIELKLVWIYASFFY